MPAADDRKPAIQLDLLHQGIQIGLDVPSILIRVNSEIAEFAALAAKGNVQVESKGSSWVGRRAECGQRIGDITWLPKRKRRIIGDEVVAKTGFFLIR